MFTGVSISMRCSSQSTSSEACPLVLEAANLHPALPVHATSPVRSGPASYPRPRAARAASASGIRSSGMSEISRFCHTVSRRVPEPKRSATAARPCMRSVVMRPTGSTTPT